MKTLKVVDVSRGEGPLYEVMGEDEKLVVFDSWVDVLASDGKCYVHKTFVVKGYSPAREVADGEWCHAYPNRGYKEDVEAFASKVRARGVIDLRFWEEVKPRDLEADWAAEAEREADERRGGG